MGCWTRRGAATALMALGALALLGRPAQGATTTRVSVDSNGSIGTSASLSPSISGNGRFVAFESDAANLVPGDTYGFRDVFVHDRQTGQTTRVSIASDGTQADGASSSPSISADGRFVAFQSEAVNLVPGDTFGFSDIFVRDRQTNQTTRVSVDSDGNQADGHSYAPSISADGRLVAFESDATNLVPGDTFGYRDVFVHDRQTGETTRVSVASNGAQAESGSWGAAISADGQFVGFGSGAWNLVPNDTYGKCDIFVHDRQTGQTTRVSVASGGGQADNDSLYLSISGDGRFVAFESYASNLVLGDTYDCCDIFVHDRQTGQTARVSVASDGSQADRYSYAPSISADGRFVAFESNATNLVPGDTFDFRDVFVHDRQTGQTTRVSVASDGTQADQPSRSASISSDGRLVAFDSSAVNLAPGDQYGWTDVFVHDRGTTSLVVTSFAIDSGAASTSSHVVTLNNTSAGSPTHYMAAEAPSFTGASWLPYSAAPSFTLSAGTGTKTVYFKVKHASGESSMVWDTILIEALTGLACVDDSNTTGVEDGTAQHPYDTLQEGIDATADGGVVKVARGTYSGSITVDGKSLTLQGGYPGGTYPGTGNFGDASRNPDPVTNGTRLDGGGAGCQVVCTGAARGSALSGFRVSGGGLTCRGAVLRRVVATGQN